ncbi:MAG: hypothetical protein KGS44_02745 [Alphaproteobacteria bacterium]|nr:hypothetical protein [Alphaproteobacteria bacterium]
MKMLFACLAATALLIAPALAKPLASGQFSGAITGGVENPIGGDVHGGTNAPLASLAALNPNLPAVNAELRIQARSFEDIYGEAASFGVEGAYGLGGGRELFGALRAIEAEEAQAQVGQAFVPALSASLPVFGRFGAFQALSLEGGVRQYFDLGGGFAPYIGGRVGLTQVDGIRATFTVPVPAGVGAEPNDIALNNVRFYDDSTAFTVGLDVGVSFELAPGFSVGLDTGLRYQSGLKDDDRDIGALGLASINNEGDRLSVPLTLRAAFRF